MYYRMDDAYVTS